MNIQVINQQGDQLVLSPKVQPALDRLDREGGIPEADWKDLERKILNILAGDGFDKKKLQPEISYFDTKEGKKIQGIKINYAA
jgi:hypothetical protein